MSSETKVKKKKVKKVSKEKKKVKKKEEDDEQQPEDKVNDEEVQAQEPKIREQRAQQPEVVETQTHVTPEKPSYNDSDAFSLGYICGRNHALKEPTIFPSWQEMAVDKYHFIRFLKSAVDSHTPEFRQLYNFLLMCFTQADVDFDGTVSATEFSNMIEIAASAPRKFGFAPTISEMESKIGAEQVSKNRKVLFQNMLKTGQNGITFDAWLGYAVSHIKEKVQDVEIEQSGIMKEGEAFHNFFKHAMKKGSMEYKELYSYLLDCFSKVDLDHDGGIGFHEFDSLLLNATKILKEYGFPTNKCGLERVEYHKEIFPDKNGDHIINFEEWLDYARTHIASKIAAR